ncbi:MAG: hypothetical protein ILP04_07085 [Bacteroidales bacterium]|nr:hypothetical protein [Bacteroidales bacterium]
MKQIFKLLMAALLLLPFVSCEELGGLSKDSLVGTWRSEKILINDERVDFTLTITMLEDGSGYLDDIRDRFQYEIDGNKLTVRPKNDEEFTFTAEIKNSDELILTGEAVPGTGEKATFEGYFKRVSGGNDDNGNGNGDNGDDTGDGSYSDENITISAVGNPTWEREGNIYFVTYNWNFRINNEQLVSNIFTEDGRDYTYGIGHYPVGKENTPPRYFNGNDQGRDTHMQVDASQDGRQIFVRSRIKADNDKTARCYVYLSKRTEDGGMSDGAFYYGGVFTIKFDPDAATNTGDNGIGVTKPEFESSTSNSLTVRASFTGNYSSSEPFKDAACGFMYCPENEGEPEWGKAQMIDCTQSAWDNNGQKFVGTIENLEAETMYNVRTWLLLAPDADPVLSDWCTMGTSQNNGGGDTGSDWIRLGEVHYLSNINALEVNCTAYFDTGDPIAIGVCYNTTGNPTINDIVYNAFDHYDFETGSFDETLGDIHENKDGSRSIKLFLLNVSPKTVYYIRGYMQWESEDIHPLIYDSDGGVTIETGEGESGSSSNIGVADVTLVSRTSNSLTVQSNFTGDITGPEMFQDAVCGFLYCPESEGEPKFGSAQQIDCTASAWENNGQKFVGTISNLTPDVKYNVRAWVQMKRGEVPILGNWNTHSTEKSGGQGGGDQEVNWIRVEQVQSNEQGDELLIACTGYFDTGDPIAIGACYNTTGNPTVSDDVYNAFLHMNLEKGSWDETITGVYDNQDGSKTVKFIVKGVNPGTTYYVRGYIQWSSDDIHPVVYSEKVTSFTTPGQKQ